MKHVTRIVLAALILAPASVSLSPAAFAKGLAVEAATKSQKKDAVAQYRLGVDLLSEGKSEEALRLFQSSYEMVASPNSRLMVARALVKLGRYPEAYRELLATIAEARELAPEFPKYEETVEAAQAELVDVSAKVALLKLKVDGKVTVNATPLEAANWHEVQPLDPGEVKLSYELQNGQRVERLVVLDAGSTTEVELFSPEPVARAQASLSAPHQVAPADSAGVSRGTLAWVGTGVGAAGLITFTVFGLLNNSQFSDLEKSCPRKRCPGVLADDAERGRNYQTLANVGLGVGLVGGLTAAYFFLTDDGGAVDEELNLGERAKRATTELMVGPGNVMIRGQF